MSYEFFAKYYDSLTTNVNYGEHAAYISRIFAEHKPGCSLVVDLACGTGSLSVELQKLGYDMIAVDSSYEMLSVAREKCPGMLLLCQSMQELDLYGTVDGVVCALDSVNHVINPEQLKLAFERVALFLEPDGVFIFDANTPYKHERVLADNAYVYQTEDVFCVWQNHNIGGGQTEIELDFFERNDNSYARYCECFRERAYSSDQLTEMLSECGLKIIRQYDDYTFSAPADTSQRIVYVCKKL